MRGSSMSLAVLGVTLPASAHATTGLLCTPIAGAGPKLSIIVGAEGVMGAALFEGGRWLSSYETNGAFTMVKGSLDGRYARVDLVGRGAKRSKVRLRVTMHPSKPPRWVLATGTLRRLGRTYRVDCVQD